MNETTHRWRRGLRAALLCGFGGAGGFVSLWALAFFPALHPFLFLSLRVINRTSCTLVGFKLVPDGGPSTLYASMHFFFVGAATGLMIDALIGHRGS